jgi:hypothetical protein
MNKESATQTALQMLRFSVAEGHRRIIGARPDMMNSIFCDIARRVEVVADACLRIMDIERIAGKPRAAIAEPNDTVIITVDRYLTGQQLQVVGAYYQKKLPNTKIVMLSGGVSAQVVKTESLPSAIEIPVL